MSLAHPDKFTDRHIGPDENEILEMVQATGASSLDELITQVVPGHLRRQDQIQIPEALTENQALSNLKGVAQKNKVGRSLLGLGYYDCILPGVIQRNVFENPGWYTQYTPYQAEIAQGRLEALLNFQTLITDLTGMEIANASLLDEATAAAEGMSMLFARRKDKSKTDLWVLDSIYPQTLAVMKTRAEPLGITLRTSSSFNIENLENTFAVLLPQFSSDGQVMDLNTMLSTCQENGIRTIVSTDLMALTIIKPPGELGADVVVGSSQRFGQPLGLGGPHAAFFATKDEFKRNMPGRLVGISKDAAGKSAYRLTLQTREQHIRREKATSNICTAQVLLAILASMYAVYHGPRGLTAIARKIHGFTTLFAHIVRSNGGEILHENYFDTLSFRLPTKNNNLESYISEAKENGIHLRLALQSENAISIAFDEKTDENEILALCDIFKFHFQPDSSSIENTSGLGHSLLRTTSFLNHEVFNKYRSETQMLRYIKKLESRDLSLAYSMIPLGSCTMKLNASAEMYPVSWPEFGSFHPYTPSDNWTGYSELFTNLEDWLASITGFDGVSLQPNAGSQGEFAGLLAIRGFHQSKGDTERNICLIPSSAHGTNPASAVMAGMKVVVVQCDENGNIDVADLESKATKYKDTLAALMVTYPSTHGVFEETIKNICSIIHDNGGQVYMDGANLNALVGLCSPKELGADVCHINLHKTFCIPHGGGGPGMGPIAVSAHLIPYLPCNPLQSPNPFSGSVSSAHYSSASILVIPWMYIRMMGPDGLKKATEIAILNANYIATQLKDYYPILYTGSQDRVAHECILDLRHFKKISVEDVAKRLMDFGFHAPTVSWPVGATLMVEPTESESKEELDRFCQAMIAIKAEIEAVESGETKPEESPLKHAPHTASQISSDSWNRTYTRQQAAFPAEWVQDHKFWPAVARIDNVFGDRNPVCTCPSPEEFED